MSCSFDISFPSIREPIPDDETARIRFLFGQDVSARFYRNSTGNKGDKKAVTGGWFSDDWLYGRSNQSIGMPNTPNVERALKPRKPGQYRIHFREYQVKAGQPLTLSMTFSSFSVSPNTRMHSSSCGPVVVTFTPLAGEDYEATLEFDYRRCFIRLNRILVQDNEAVLVPVMSR
jgi:hypothetical protein